MCSDSITFFGVMRFLDFIIIIKIGFLLIPFFVFLLIVFLWVFMKDKVSIFLLNDAEIYLFLSLVKDWLFDCPKCEAEFFIWPFVVDLEFFTQKE